MNWLGKLITENIRTDDTILDLGCGTIFPLTDQKNPDETLKHRLRHFMMNRMTLKNKSYLGVDLFDKYLDVGKKYFPVIKMDIRKTEIFMDDSFDIVLALDTIEHLSEKDATALINEMERIARKKVIIYTPSQPTSNEENVKNAFEQGENQLQLHQSYIPPEYFAMKGYKVTFPKPNKNTFAVKKL